MTEPALDTDGATRDVATLSRSLAGAAQSSALLGKALTSAFDGIVLKGRDVSDTFRTIALSMSQSILKSSLQTLGTGLTGMLSGALSGGSSIPFARGGVLRAGSPQPFAAGGIVASPTTFPLAGNRMGLMGEAGPEAIMPLRRGRDGRLGVAAASDGGAPITINISAADVDSFRRSETQVAALLARAVARGQRGL